ncbi:MAG: phage Gp37/Gp68 family protein [Sutterellaceae bacterium]|nr:phage Gp37/Gp68 family protein [Sutterellaceae bacterium]MDY2868643.1 DUF5131 family protein [Mesosutterella sp.]
MREGEGKIHDIWNRWHGCVKKSEGCKHCYMYALDKAHGRLGSDIYRVESNFRYPLSRNRDGSWKVKSGEMIRVCMTSDFFLEEADPWREEAWDIMRARPDVVFYLLTKRPERVSKCLPGDWGEGWENIFFNISAENQKRADERMPILLDLPFRHKGVSCAPLIGPVTLARWLDRKPGAVELVSSDGENYDGNRPLDFEWVKRLRVECEARGITFAFYSLGNVFVKDGRTYRLPKDLQVRMAWKSGMNFRGRPIRFLLRDRYGDPIPEKDMYVRHFRERCRTCSMRITCNGCGDCGRCRGPVLSESDMPPQPNWAERSAVKP